jgi:hypothetical protein
MINNSLKIGQTVRINYPYDDKGNFRFDWYQLVGKIGEIVSLIKNDIPDCVQIKIEEKIYPFYMGVLEAVKEKK